LGVLLAFNENTAVLDYLQEPGNRGFVFLMLKEEGEEFAVFFQAVHDDCELFLV